MVTIQGEWHLPGHNFTGPGTKLQYRLERGDEPINKVDALSLHHDMRYQFYGDSEFEVFRADVQFIAGSIGIVFSPSSTMRERGEAVFVGGVMGLKLLAPAGRLLKLGNKLRRLRKINPGISVVV